MAAFIESRRRRGPEDSKKKKSEKKGSKNHDTFSMYACHPCAGTMLIFSVSFQFLRMTTRRWFHRRLLRLPYKQPLLCLTVSLWVSGFAWFQLVSIQMVWFECALDEFAFHTLRSPVHSFHHTFAPFVLSHPSYTLSTLLQDELFRLKILFFMTQLLHLGSSNRNTIIPYTHGPSRNCEATSR